MNIEDAFELLAPVLDRHRAELVKDPADFHPVVGMRIPAVLRGDQHPPSPGAAPPDVRRVVMEVAQDEVRVLGQLSQQWERGLVVAWLRWVDLGGQRVPYVGA